MIQSGNRLSGDLLLPEEPGFLEDLEELGCSLSCPVPGTCTLACPGVQCAVRCTPATPNCVQKVSLSGTVSGSSVNFTFTGAFSSTATCSGSVFGTLTENDSVDARFQGTLVATTDGQLTISGSFTDRENVTCTGTGLLSEDLECVGGTSSGSFPVRITPKPMSIAAFGAEAFTLLEGQRNVVPRYFWFLRGGPRLLLFMQDLQK